MANEKRLIDADKLMDRFRIVAQSGGPVVVHVSDICAAIEDEVYEESVDAVEVVRCKDCENRVYVDNGDEIGEIGGCKLFKMAMPYDSFCSYGKRWLTENV